nr:MAG TPA: retropepsin [Caudoviricetes sp.]
MSASPHAIYHAFTVDYPGKSNKLITQITIFSGDRSIKGNALWDTGATTSCISESVSEQLSLVPTGMMNIQTPSSTKAVNTYLVSVGLPNHLRVNDIPVCDTDIGKQGLEMLIGMDIITLGDFSVSHFNDKTAFTFRFPSKERIDFVPQSNIDNIIGPTHGKGNSKRKKKR